MADFDIHFVPAVDPITATSKLQVDAVQIRKNTPNWSAYLRSRLISEFDYSFLSAYENTHTKEERTLLLTQCNRDGEVVQTFVNLVNTLAKDEVVCYLLTLLDDMIQEDQARVEIFHSAAKTRNTNAYSWFLGILQRNDMFIVNQMSSIIAKLAAYCSPSSYMEEYELHYYFSFLKDQLRLKTEYINTIARCLQIMLKLEEYREPFVEANGIQAVLITLSVRVNFQLQYQLVFTLWSLTCTNSIVSKAVSSGIIQILGDILSESSKEKVIRIILATFSNILKKTEERLAKRGAALQLVQCKTLKTLALMGGKHPNDPELEDDLKFLHDELQLSLQDLSSFDEYYSEIISGRLHWSPVHRSDTFWRENSTRLNENNYEVIKILIRILESNRDSECLCVAAHDIGEYVRHCPQGKIVVEQLQGKQAVMKLLSASDPNIRYHALLAVQKLMVLHWEFLERCSERE